MQTLAMNESFVRELTMDELNSVAGGLFPALIAAYGAPVVWGAIGGAATAGFGAGITVGLNYVNRTNK